MADLDDDELLEALGVEVAPIKAGGRTPREERITDHRHRAITRHATASVHIRRTVPVRLVTPHGPP